MEEVKQKRLTVRFHSYECLEKAKTWRQKDRWLPLAGAGKRTDRRVTKRHQRGLELFTVSVAIEVMSLHANIKHLSNCTSKVSKFQLWGVCLNKVIFKVQTKKIALRMIEVQQSELNHLYNDFRNRCHSPASKARLIHLNIIWPMGGWLFRPLSNYQGIFHNPDNIFFVPICVNTLFVLEC